MSLARTERRLAAIMLADIAGYSALMERDEARTFGRIRALRDQVINPKVAEFGGRVIKTTGDGFLAEFPSSTAALGCGITIQRTNFAQEATKDEAERFHLRIGINLGDIISDGDDVSGDGVNVVGRLEPLAPARRHLRFGRGSRPGQGSFGRRAGGPWRAAGEEHFPTDPRLSDSPGMAAMRQLGPINPKCPVT